LIKIVLFGYSRELISFGSLEKACSENIIFMALACGQKPNHSTITGFVSSIDQQIAPLFTKVLMVCDEEGLLGGWNLFSATFAFAGEWTGSPYELRPRLISNGCCIALFTTLRRS